MQTAIINIPTENLATYKQIVLEKGARVTMTAQRMDVKTWTMVLLSFPSDGVLYAINEAYAFRTKGLYSRSSIPVL